MAALTSAPRATSSSASWRVPLAAALCSAAHPASSLHRLRHLINFKLSYNAKNAAECFILPVVKGLWKCDPDNRGKLRSGEPVLQDFPQYCWRALVILDV